MTTINQDLLANPRIQSQPTDQSQWLAFIRELSLYVASPGMVNSVDFGLPGSSTEGDNDFLAFLTPQSSSSTVVDNLELDLKEINFRGPW